MKRKKSNRVGITTPQLTYLLLHYYRKAIAIALMKQIKSEEDEQRKVISTTPLLSLSTTPLLTPLLLLHKVRFQQQVRAEAQSRIRQMQVSSTTPQLIPLLLH